MKVKNCTLIITTYNWVEALELVLLSVKKQSVLPTEVIIADDGSKPETKDLIMKFQKNFPTKLIHIWQEDKGFRKTVILNKSISKSTCKYLIQIDGDIIIHKHFIKNHLKLAEKGFFIEGSRVWLNEKLTNKAQKTKQIQFPWYIKGIKNRLNAMYLPFLSPFFQKKGSSVAYVVDTRGCNMSFWKEDVIKINGYNEAVTGWGREDSELAVRLLNVGVLKKRIKFGAIQFHQYHKENSRDKLNKNDEILAETIGNKSVFCEQGVVK